MDNRAIAKSASRNVYKYAAQLASEESLVYMNQGYDELDARLLAEADATDRWDCSSEDMLKLLRKEYATVQGQTLGGFIKAARNN